MSKTISELLPNEGAVVLVQAKVEKALVKLVKAKMVRDRKNKRRVTWKDLITASFRRYLEEGTRK